MLDDRDVIQHLVRRIDATPVVEEPFPHMIVDELLPEAAYRDLLAAWPPDTVFKVNHSMQRHDMHLRGDLAAMPEAVRPTWLRVLTWTLAANRRVARKFAPHARLKYEPFQGKAWEAAIDKVPHIAGEAQLAYYTGATGLAPHIDHPKLVTNAFLYCSERAEAEPELGTVLYGSRGFSIPDNRVRLPPDLVAHLLIRDKSVAYAPNVCLAYLNTPRSFHGVDPIDLGERRRRLLMFGTALREKDAIRLFGPQFAAQA